MAISIQFSSVQLSTVVLGSYVMRTNNAQYILFVHKSVGMYLLSDGIQPTATFII